MLRVDLTEMQFADDEFDVIICNHVLEHIPDDRTAMAELLRVLRPGGFAVLLVPDPHKLERTIEDPDAPPEERARRFGQADHVRLYGADYEDRLKEAGFGVRIWMARDAEPELCRQWALDPIERVYIGTKA
jgi:SAM-dependent methyltransferase